MPTKTWREKHPILEAIAATIVILGIVVTILIIFTNKFDYNYPGTTTDTVTTISKE